MNRQVQVYYTALSNIPIHLEMIDAGAKKMAMRFRLAGSNQLIWIPKKHLAEDGTINVRGEIDYVLRKASYKLTLAGYRQAIPGIKRDTTSDVRVPKHNASPQNTLTPEELTNTFQTIVKNLVTANTIVTADTTSEEKSDHFDRCIHSAIHDISRYAAQARIKLNDTQKQEGAITE